jgi:hypothetical protein
MPPRYYVSITGLQVKSYFHLPQFFYHALPSIRQAERAAGNISTSSNYIKGMQHTMTVWENREYMLQYLQTGAHLQAMKTSPIVGRYVKVYGYCTDTIPDDWKQARQLWEEKGRVILGKPCQEHGDLIVGVATERAGNEMSARFDSCSALAMAAFALGLVLVAAVVALAFGLGRRPWSPTEL